MTHHYFKNIETLETVLTKTVSKKLNDKEQVWLLPITKLIQAISPIIYHHQKILQQQNKRLEKDDLKLIFDINYLENLVIDKQYQKTFDIEKLTNYFGILKAGDHDYSIRYADLHRFLRDIIFVIISDFLTQNSQISLYDFVVETSDDKDAWVCVGLKLLTVVNPIIKSHIQANKPLTYKDIEQLCSLQHLCEIKQGKLGNIVNEQDLTDYLNVFFKEGNYDYTALTMSDYVHQMVEYLLVQKIAEFFNIEKEMDEQSEHFRNEMNAEFRMSVASTDD